jgi:hypothetical protein
LSTLVITEPQVVDWSISNWGSYLGIHDESEEIDQFVDDDDSKLGTSDQVLKHLYTLT